MDLQAGFALPELDKQIIRNYHFVPVGSHHYVAAILHKRILLIPAYKLFNRSKKTRGANGEVL
jgi:hypothetical protein